MLKKVKGVINITKLKAILLLKVDFNALNKIIFNGRVIQAIERKYSIPYDIIRGRRDYLAAYITLNKS